MGMGQVYDALQRCDLFISVGTSGNVYPAAGFVDTVNAHGGHSVELNLEPSTTQSRFERRIYGPAGSTLPSFLAALLHLDPA